MASDDKDLKLYGDGDGDTDNDVDCDIDCDVDSFACACRSLHWVPTLLVSHGGEGLQETMSGIAMSTKSWGTKSEWGILLLLQTTSPLLAPLILLSSGISEGKLSVLKAQICKKFPAPGTPQGGAPSLLLIGVSLNECHIATLIPLLLGALSNHVYSTTSHLSFYLRCNGRRGNLLKSCKWHSIPHWLSGSFG